MMTVRVCPVRDTVCPHGMDCPYSIDRYSCRDEKADPPPMTDALIERLESNAADIKSSRVGLPSYDSQLMAEAAQALKAKDAEIAELNAAFDLCWKADMRAIERWQKAHPGKELVWPDRANMVVWLLEELAIARNAAIEEAAAHIENSTFSREALPIASDITAMLRALKALGGSDE